MRKQSIAGLLSKAGKGGYYGIGLQFLQNNNASFSSYGYFEQLKTSIGDFRLLCDIENTHTCTEVVLIIYSYILVCSALERYIAIGSYIRVRKELQKPQCFSACH